MLVPSVHLEIVLKAAFFSFCNLSMEVDEMMGDKMVLAY